MGYPTNQVSLMFSFLSTLTTSITLVCLAVWLPVNKLNLRWKLIINLLLSELYNASNNSISGIYGRLGELKSGPGCVANGFVGQLTVQAADISTLAIAIVTFITIRSLCSDMKKLEKLASVLISIIWIYPLSTAIAGYFWVGYEPTSSNWCWLAPNVLARYVLTHGLRIMIFIVIIILYTIIGTQLISKAKEVDVESFETASVIHEKQDTGKTIYNATIRLMAYPIAYIILWAPGMANRLLEALNQKSELAAFLQSFTQLIGFADAILTLWNLRAIQDHDSE